MTEPPRGRAHLADVLRSFQARFLRASASRPPGELEAEARAAARTQRQLALHRQPLPITPDMQRAIVDDELGATLALAAVARWLELERRERKPILVLHGQTGSGKSVAAAYALVRQQTAIWCGWRTILEASRALYGEAAQRWHVLQTVKFLVIDDLGTEPDRTLLDMSDALLELLAYRHHGHTLITTRMSQRQVATRYGSAPLDRLLADTADDVSIEDAPAPPPPAARIRARTRVDPHDP